MGWQEILIIAVVLLVLFGAKRIPDLMKGVGKGINEFNQEKKKSISPREENPDEK